MMPPPPAASACLVRLLVLLTSGPLWIAATPARAAEPQQISDRVLPTFAPATYQPVAAPFLVRLLDDEALARRLLQSGAFVRREGRFVVKPMVRRKRFVLFRITMELAGQGQVEVLFKPRQQGYRDWATEIAACRLARQLGLRVPPCAARLIPRRVLEGALVEVPSSCRQGLRWQGDALFGFFRIWAPGYRSTLGDYKPTRDNLQALASWLRARHRRQVSTDPVLGGLPGLFLLDYLIYNDDRQWNLGTVRTDQRTLRLFPIDFGEGLSSGLSRRSFSHRLFHRTTLFPHDAIIRLKRLDRPTLLGLLRGPGRQLLVEQRHLDQILSRRKAALEHVRWAAQQLGEGVFY